MVKINNDMLTMRGPDLTAYAIVNGMRVLSVCLGWEDSKAELADAKKRCDEKPVIIVKSSKRLAYQWHRGYIGNCCVIVENVAYLPDEAEVDEFIRSTLYARHKPSDPQVEQMALRALAIRALMRGIENINELSCFMLSEHKHNAYTASAQCDIGEVRERAESIGWPLHIALHLPLEHVIQSEDDRFSLVPDEGLIKVE